jgi:predicted nucleic acid-binding protein
MKYVLDTSAILALFQDEAGAEPVARIFEARERGEASILVSFMTIFEASYLARATGGADTAFSLVFQIRGLGMEEIWPDEDLLWLAGEIKAAGGLSVADAFIAASAVLQDAILVHKDAEFERLKTQAQALGQAQVQVQTISLMSPS